jgi:hypothetical protein
MEKAGREKNKRSLGVSALCKNGSNPYGDCVMAADRVVGELFFVGALIVLCKRGVRWGG